MSLIYQWIQKFTSIYNEETDVPKPSIAVDAEGNFYVVYVCINPISGQTNVGMIDVCVAKLSPDGNAIWFRQQPSFDTNQDDVDPCISVDPSGNVYVTYCTSGDVSGQITTITSTDVVVFKLNSNGDTLWVKQSTDFNTDGQDTSPVIATDVNGNVYVAYSSYDSTAITYYDHIVLFKLDTDGNTVWVKKTDTFNTPGGNYSPSIAVDDSGNCYVGYFCDGYPASGESEVGGYDIVIFKTDTDGNLLWIRQRPTFDTIDDDSRPSITVDTYGSIYAANRTRGITSGQSYSGGFSDIAVYKMDTNGNLVWIKQNPTFNTDRSEFATSIGVDSLGMIYVAYCTSGVVSGQTLTGTQDIVVMQMDNDGNVTTILQESDFNTSYENVYPFLTVDLQGNVGVAYYSVNPGLADIESTQELVVFKLRNLVCVHGETLILLADGISKPIKDIQRGDIVVPNHQVARVCQEKIDRHSKISLVIFEKNAFGNRPDQRLIVTPNHPIFYKNARRPAKCFAKCPNVTLLENIPVDQVLHLFGQTLDICLYDLQFDHDGSYLANGIEVQSRSPYSYCGPLPLDLYYDPSLYCTDRVWDSMDQILPLETRRLDFNVLMLKNKRHEFSDVGVDAGVVDVVDVVDDSKWLPISIVRYN